jgi:hypothetical protein
MPLTDCMRYKFVMLMIGVSFLSLANEKLKSYTSPVMSIRLSTQTIGFIIRRLKASIL